MNHSQPESRLCTRGGAEPYKEKPTMKEPAMQSTRLRVLGKRITPLLMSILMLTADPATAASFCLEEDCRSEMLTMAYIANLSGGVDLPHHSRKTVQELITEATVERIQCALDKPVGSLENGWKTVWGPAVWGPGLQKRAGATLERTPANTMFVARYKASNVYVVSIAGTNPSSDFDWVFEDLNIHPTPWPGTKFSDQTSVTRGTLLGLESLRDMRPERPGQAVGIGLYDFLAGVATQSSAENKATIYVVGHSLGGALAPAVALWLSDERQGGSSIPGWDPEGHTTLQVYAYAGPTPGNEKFADYIHSRFPGVPSTDQPTHDGMQIVTTTLDVVPRSFKLRNLKTLASLYNTEDIYPTARVERALDDLVDRVEASGVHYRNLGTRGQTYGIGAPLLPKYKLLTNSPPCLVTKERLAKAPATPPYNLEALFQHVCQYPLGLHLPHLLDELDCCAHPDRC